MTAPAPTPNHDVHDTHGTGDHTTCDHDVCAHAARLNDDDVDRPPGGDVPCHGLHGHHGGARGLGGRAAQRHGVGMSDADRATLTELISSAPLPSPDVLARLRGYLPPSVPD
jgi:hypothetical protein